MKVSFSGFVRSVKSFINDVIRLFRLLKKPKKEEYWFVAKVTALGVAVLGMLGYIIQTLNVLI